MGIIRIEESLDLLAYPVKNGGLKYSKRAAKGRTENSRNLLDPAIQVRPLS